MRTKEKDKLEKRQKVIEHLEKDVEELRRLSGDGEADSELERIRQQVAELRREFYIHLGPWQRAQIARHQQRSEEHTSELQSQSNLVCRLLLEKKKKTSVRY